jgi:hypothetical protein
VQKFPVAAWRDCADVPQLFRVPNDDRRLGPEQKRQGGGDVTLAGFVDHDKVEETWFG